MTRFTRAKGSKASNERLPEEATSWHEMKQQMLDKSKESADDVARQANDQKRLENYRTFLKEKEKEQEGPVQWAEFSIKSPKSSNVNILSEHIIKGDDSAPLEMSSKIQPKTLMVKTKNTLKKKRKLSVSTVPAQEIRSGTIVSDKKLETLSGVDRDTQGEGEAPMPNCKLAVRVARKIAAKGPRAKQQAKKSSNPVERQLTENDLNKIEKKKQRRLKQIVKREELKEELRKFKELLKAQETPVVNGILKPVKTREEPEAKPAPEVKLNSAPKMEKVNKSLVKNPKSIVKDPKSKVKGLKSKVKDAKRVVKDPKSKVKGLRSKVNDAKNIVKDPKSKVKGLKSKVKDGKSIVKHPKSKVKGPKSEVKDEETIVNDPKSKVKDPKVKVKGQKYKSFKKRNQLKFNEIMVHGKKITLAYFDGFRIKKEDAIRLKALKNDMVSKGLPRSQISAALKLERRRAEKALEREKKMVCFHCRKAGHNLADCPELSKDQMGQFGTGICFKCGSTEHTHFQCKVVKGDEYKFACCFICKEQGHISKQCPDNARGLYPKGGACKVCGDVTHLKKDCPQHQAQQQSTSDMFKVETLNGGNPDVMEVKVEKPLPMTPPKKIVRLT